MHTGPLTAVHISERDSDLPVCHLLPVPAEGVVGWSGLTAAQCLPQAAVEGAEAPQVGYELPEAVKERECSTLRQTKKKTSVILNVTHTHYQQGKRA